MCIDNKYYNIFDGHYHILSMSHEIIPNLKNKSFEAYSMIMLSIYVMFSLWEKEKCCYVINYKLLGISYVIPYRRFDIDQLQT